MINYPGAEFIDDTAAAHTGRFGKIVALEDSVINTATAVNYTGNTLSAIPFKASCEIEGVFTSITLTSGTVVAYKI
jgi:hypothetical protein